jgi:hypothetical protein
LPDIDRETALSIERQAANGDRSDRKTDRRTQLANGIGGTQQIGTKRRMTALKRSHQKISDFADAMGFDWPTA